MPDIPTLLMVFSYSVLDLVELVELGGIQLESFKHELKVTESFYGSPTHRCLFGVVVKTPG